MAAKPKFRKGQIVMVLDDTERYIPIRLRGRDNSIGDELGWFDDFGNYTTERKFRPLNAREVGPDWVRKEAKRGKRKG